MLVSRLCTTGLFVMTGVSVSDKSRLGDATGVDHEPGVDRCWCGLRHGHNYRQGSGNETVSVQAGRLLAGDRQAEYGDARNTHERIAVMWNALIPQGSRIQPTDVALMMIALKLVRAAKNPSHRDSWVDIVGYAEIGARLSEGDA